MSRSSYNLLHYISTLFFPIYLGLALIFLLTRSYEWAVLIYNHGYQLLNLHYIISGILYDLILSIGLAIPLSYLYHVLHKLAPNKSTDIISATTTIIGVANIFFTTYYSITLVPLGAEFWAYSLSEITDTVIASELLSFRILILLPVVIVLLYWIIKKVITQPYSKSLQKNLSKFLAATLLLLATILWMTPSQERGKDLYQQNKLASFVKESVISLDALQWLGVNGNDIGQKYPFLHASESSNNLGPYFKDTSSLPNIVFVIVESLGGEFIGPSGQWTGFTPFLDSLAQKGLYWENGLSLSGRTFGVLPSLLGSLPPRENGFMDLGPDYPNHLTLISLLDNRGYHTAFYSGYETYFDKLDYFLHQQSTDFILNKQKIDELLDKQAQRNSTNYWGYDDKTMLNLAHNISDTTTASPRLEIYHTLQSHSPFTIPNEEIYRQKFSRRLKELEKSQARKNAYQQYQKELMSLLYTDDALRRFFQQCRQQEEFENTIFVITGDHWLIPIPQTTQISRYHVPIIIYSPLLKNSAQFKAVNTHANIVPSLVNYLDQDTNLSMPLEVPWIGRPLDTSRTFRNTHSIPLMKNKKQLTDFIDDGYYLSDNQLFSLQEGLNLIEIQNSKQKEEMRSKLDRFKAKTNYAVTQDKLYPDSISVAVTQEYTLITQYDSLFQKIDSTETSPEAQFQLAREKTFNGNYDAARAICKRLLMRYPDYHDVRILLGRTYAWNNSYKEAEQIFREVLKKEPDYYDTYNALYDLKRWTGKPREALKIINKGLSHHPELKQFLEKKIKILVELGNTEKARKVYRKMKDLHAAHEEIKDFETYTSK